MNFTVESLEFYLLILIRISTFIMSAPFFNANTIPMRVKMSLSVMLTLVMIPVVPVITLDYVGVIGYASLILQEAAVGLIL